MKNIFKITLCICLLFSAFNCSNETDNLEIQTEAPSSLIEGFENHLFKFNNSNTQRVELNQLKKLLDYSNNYQNTIHSLIMNEKNIKPTLNKNNQINEYKNPTKFDQFLVKELLNNLLNDNISVFFSKMHYYQEFLDRNINNASQFKFLNNTIEQFKWIKYSTASKLDNSLGDYDPDCFDDCMSNKISDYFDEATWLEWANFLVAPGRLPAIWAADCIWHCHIAP